MKRRSRPVKMDAKLSDYVPMHFDTGKVADLFGLEIELEGRNIITEAMAVHTYWGMHKDGSLRAKGPGDQCIEYVSKGPQNMTQVVNGLTNLMAYLNKPNVTVYDSYRTSIHVHVNCMEETFRTIVNFITLSMIFDELFVSQNGQTRIGNNFCLRTRDAEGQIADVISSLTTYGNPYQAISQNNRYSSVNMASLGKFGTMEFRSLECTTDLDRILHWVKTCQALKVAARGYENPREIISAFSRKGPLGFMIATLGECAPKYIAVPDYHDMLHTGMRLAQDLAYCSEWVPPTQEELKERVRVPKFKYVNPAQYFNDLNAIIQPAAAPPPGALGAAAIAAAQLNNNNQFWGNNPAAPAPQPAGWEDPEPDDEPMHNLDDLDDDF